MRCVRPGLVFDKCVSVPELVADALLGFDAEQLSLCFYLVRVAGFEPATPSSRTRCASGDPLNVQRFSSMSIPFVHVRFTRSCGRPVAE